ncbi:MFS transporter [Microtetraspora sp. NBRC 13810]|uniref:MFS transporter n=1 Tax=Microtetraspora sp. NBRC 13810 TaxID=3030990 RepID=UPI0024A3CF32|nr:MFS transporter [Microtetraspora sp. NBRC 13810]GLW06217.1 MFS transporter [Microtetraspora sp. NBRC 13810]
MESHSQQAATVAVPSPPAAPPHRPALILTVLSAAAFMAGLDVFIVNVAFTGIGRDFSGVSLPDLSWILNAYTIVYAALLVPLGRLADRYGRKAGFMAGLALFTLASAACAASSGLWALVAFRVLQAVGAAMLTPASLGLLVAANPPERRARAVRIWAASGALASALGPVLGGLLVEASWQWVFLVNIPVGVVALVAAARLVPDSRDTAAGRIPDVLGAIVLALAIGALTLALVQGPDRGWASAGILTAFAVVVLAAAVFGYRMTRHPAPIVEPALLRVRAFAWSNVTSVLFSVAFAANLLGVIQWMQQVWHYSPLQTGLAVAPGPLMVPVVSALAHRFGRRVPVGVQAGAGCLLFALGSVVLLLSVGTTPHYATDLLPGWLIGGAGVGLALPTILSAATADLPPARAATGSAVVNMSRQIGTSLGVALLVAVLAGTAASGDVLSSYVHAWWATAGVGLLAAVTALGMTPPRRPAHSS